ncbi:MAG: helix-turn-helix domain-containing protein [Actinobacteria bacterium ATB1]|nr:helix-turn-helix domain-containing protein [Actinobacteria bacterium ATB1]
MKHQSERGTKLMTVSEVADLFGVSGKTVSRWAREGRISSVRTLGGHRRFRESDIKELLDRYQQGT